MFLAFERFLECVLVHNYLREILEGYVYPHLYVDVYVLVAQIYFPQSEAKELTDINAMQLKAAMMEEVGLNFIDVEKEDELQALADKQGIPEEIEKAMLDAQTGMKKELKALSFVSSRATLESIS